MTDYELIDHTADLGIKVWATDHKDLFVKSAAAMFDVIAKPKKGKRKTAKETRISCGVKADRPQELLVNWLGELLSLADWKGLIFTRFSVSSMSDKEIRASAYGLAREHFDVLREIKAVTYHALKIEKDVDGVRAEIIFDV